MRCKRLGIMAVMSVLLATMAVSVPSAWAKPAHCDKKTGVCTPPSKLKWTSPPSIADGVPATFFVERYVSRCPCRRFATAGQRQRWRLRAVQLRWRHGRCRRQRSWTFVKTFDAGGTRDLGATVMATCLDVTNTGYDIADYRLHDIAVNP